MKHHIFRTISWLCIMAMMACSEVKGPTSLTPQLSELASFDITRNSANLSCRIEKLGVETISSIRCYYGTSLDLNEWADCSLSWPSVSVSLLNLKPNTTYYYCFEAGNGYSTVRSAVDSFVTFPNQAPIVGDLQLLGKGPTSIMLQFDLEDDGGQELLSAGFYLQAEGEAEEKMLVDLQAHTFNVRMGNLQQQTKYSIQGFAKNAIGETRTDKMFFQTEQAVKIIEPGTLKEILTEAELFNYTHLVVAGPLNGTDFRILRKMMGCDMADGATTGRMSVLDLTDAMIVSGGESYDGSHYTKQNVVGRGMFANCWGLKNIKLPYGVTEIEGGAFENCVELDSLFIPANVTRVLSSKGCTRLETIEVAKNNPKFVDFKGGLYSRDYTTLYWYPEGKMQEPVPFPEHIKCIEAYAFQYTRMTEIEIPQTVEVLGPGAFYSAKKLKSVVIPEKVACISAGLFQGCTSLTSVRLGKNVSVMSDYCFDGCPIEHLYVPIKDFLPICNEQTFAGAEGLFTNCILHVPKGCRKIYQSEKGWKNFKNIQEDIED